MRIDAREASEGAAAAQAQLVQAKAHYERTKNLVAQKFMSPSALDQAEAAYKAAQAAAGASGATLSHANVTAPISGIVAGRHTELGEMAAPGKPLITVFDPKGMRVIASVPQFKLAEIRKAGKARVEFPESGRWVDATRVEILPAADPRSHTVTARLGARRPLRLNGHAGAPRLREADGDDLLRGPRPVLALADVVDLLADEFARLRGR